MTEETAPHNEDQATVEHAPKLHQVQAKGNGEPAEDDRGRSNERPGRMSRFEWWQVVFGVCATLLGIGGYIILDRQTTLMTKQTELLGKQTTVTEQQSKLMGDQNTLMDRQTALMQQSEDSTIRYQRAIVNFKDITTKTRILEFPVKGFPPVAHSILISVQWENTGTTQTSKAVTNIEFRAEDRRGELMTLPFRNFEWRRELAIGPSSHASVTFSLPINFMATEDPLSMYIWGWVVYHDVFPSTQPRLTEFCRRIGNVAMTSRDILDPASVEVDATIPCPAEVCPDEGCPDTHNCYDEECPDYAERVRQAGPSP